MPLLYRFRVKLWDGSIQVTAAELPAFLYEDMQVPYSLEEGDGPEIDPAILRYDETNLQTGLFRGYFLLRVSFVILKCIY
jgi:hypothetical protein